MPSLRFGRFSINEPALTYDTGFYSRFQKAQQQQTLTGLYEQQRLAAKSKRILDLAIHDPKAAESAYNADPELSAGGLVRFEGTLAAGNVFTDAGTGTRFVIGPNGRLVQITGSSTAALELSEARRRQAQAAADKGVVVNTAEGVYLVKPTAGKTPRRLGGLPPSKAGQFPATGDKAIMTIRNTIADNARVQAAQETRQRYSDTTFTLTPTGDVAFGQARPEAYDYFMQRVHEIEQQNLEGLTPEIRSRVAAGLSPGPAEETTYVSRELYNYMLEKWSPEEIAAQGIEVSPGE